MVFDFDTQAGVMHLLASVRQSDLSPAQKSELRDLVFLYTNGGKDQTVRLALEQKINAYQVTPAPQKKVAQAAEVLPPQPTIGKYRVAPAFSVPETPVPTAPREKTPISSVPVFTAPPAWNPPVVEKTEQPAEVPVPQPVPEPIQSIPVPEPVPVVVHPNTTPITETNLAQPSPVSDQIDPDISIYLARIREIKASVNEKVGNPVNLVDINNEVGREYMGSLLDAMKKLNSGSSAGSAMKRLEDAYASVLQALDEYGKRGGSVANVTAAPMATPPAPPIAEPQASERQPTPVSLNQIPVTAVPYPPEPEHFSEVENNPPQPAMTNRLPINEVQPPFESFTYVAPTPPQPPTQPQRSGFASLADLADKPHTLNDLPTTNSLRTDAVAGDPLFTKEVDDGLDQLLSEWSIFKKSGLFGTGPKGKGHPLFKKMAPLHIPSLLAGRFEGATQEIKQSITDYMNGWRYEQGLIYQQGETFEHYLRRVIRHILDLQK